MYIKFTHDVYKVYIRRIHIQTLHTYVVENKKKLENISRIQSLCTRVNELCMRVYELCIHV